MLNVCTVLNVLQHKICDGNLLPYIIYNNLNLKNYHHCIKLTKFHFMNIHEIIIEDIKLSHHYLKLHKMKYGNNALKKIIFLNIDKDDITINHINTKEYVFKNCTIDNIRIKGGCIEKLRITTLDCYLGNFINDTTQIKEISLTISRSSVNLYINSCVFLNVKLIHNPKVKLFSKNIICLKQYETIGKQCDSDIFFFKKLTRRLSSTL